nr:hypothetical protein [Tanacetum cinerariifolium]
MTRVHTKTRIASLQNELQSNIYKNAKLRTQLFKKVSDQKDNTQDISKNTKFAKQPNVEILPKIGETNVLSKPVTSNSVSTTQVSKGVNNAKVIAPNMFRISPDKISREAKKVPNTVSASSRTKPITVSQPSVITKKDMNSDVNGLSSTGNLQSSNKENNGDHECHIDELSAMAFEQRSSKPRLQSMTSRQISSGLDLTYAPSTITKQQPTEGELDSLFEAMYDDYFGGQPSATVENVPPSQEPQVLERRNRTLVEAARTMLIFSRAPLLLWAEVIATACFIQNRSIIHRRFNKITYELINSRKLDISFLHVFGALFYPKNDRDDIGKLFFIGYSADSCAYRIYNHRTKKIMETMNVSFDELSAMAFEQRSSKPRLQSMTSGQISSELDLTYAPVEKVLPAQPTEGKLDVLFEAMYDDYFGGQPSASVEKVPPAQEPQVHQTSTASTTIADNIPDHPLEQVIGEPSRPVLTRNQLRSDGDMCMYALTVSTMEPKNVKEAMTDPAWIESM